MFGICTKELIGVHDPTFNKGLNAVNSFDGKIYNSGNAIWDKSFEAISVGSEIIMEVDTINWRINWTIKFKEKESARSTYINENMKSGTLYPTAIIKN